MRYRILSVVVAIIWLAGFAVSTAAANAASCHNHKSCATGSSAPPTIAIASPAAGSTVSGTVTISGTASGSAAIATAAVSIDGGVWQTASGTTSWTLSWDTSSISNGIHTLSARVTDTSGNVSSTNESVTVSNPVPDTTPPSVRIASPASGGMVSGTVSVSGSASDNVAVASVAISIDGGSWQTANGTTSWNWSWNTSTLTNGSHTIAAEAADTSGNVSQPVSQTVTVSSSSSSGGGSTGGGAAPITQGTWTSPEGVTIEVSSAGTDPDTGQPWTIADVYDMLKAQTTANSSTQSTFLQLAPHYTVDVQDSTSSETQVSYWGSPGSYSFQAMTYLQGTSGSTFANWPDYVLCHEYAIAWSQYFWVENHNASWSSYLGARLDGSTYNGTTDQYLGQDPRLGSSLTWDQREIIADDYRLVFGSSAAISESPTGVNTTIVAPQNQSGLGDWLLQQWA